MSTKVTSPDELPQKPGIYIMKDKNEKIIYIGKSHLHRQIQIPQEPC